MGCLVIEYWWNNKISVICGSCWDWTWTGPDFDNMERIKTYPTVTPLTLCPLIPLLRGRGAFVCVFTTPQRLPTQKKKQERAPSKNKPLQMISPFLSSFNFQPRIWDIHNSRWHNSRSSRHTERRCNSINTTLCHTLDQVNWPSRLTTPQPPCSS